MNPARRSTLHARGIDFHVGHWGADRAPRLVLLHGWGDCADTFDALIRPLAAVQPVAAPDMRGFGRSGHAAGDYWFADYIADVDALLQQLSPEAPVALAGHSMGAQIASLYAGVRPERVSHLVVLDGLFLPDSDSSDAVRRYRNWLHQLQHPPTARTYADFAALAERIGKQHPDLDADQLHAIAQAWGQQTADGVCLRMDPQHRSRGPLLYRAAESKAIWREVRAPTLFIDGARSPFARAIPIAEIEARRVCFAQRSEQRIDAGHMLHFDAPVATAALMADWLHAHDWR